VPPFRQARVSTLLGLLLAGILVYQFGAFDPTHDSNHARHCCPACHAGHIFATAELAAVTVIPPAEKHWYVPAETAQRTAEPAIIAGCSRAPPV